MTFKKCYANHKKSFNLIKSKNDTTLSIEYWNLKQKQSRQKFTEQEVRSDLSMSPQKQV